MLSNRLKSLVQFISYNDRVIDIGCDHALLDIYLVKYGYLNKIIVSDVHEQALNFGILNIKRENLEDKIEARLGNGLEVLFSCDELDTILISGMGTKTILNILNHSYLSKIKKLVLQSNRDYDILRKQVIKLGFCIAKEEVIKDNGKVYINIVFLRGEKRYSKEEIKYGTKDMINKEVYYDYLIRKKKDILSKLKNSAYKKDLLKEIKVLEQYMSMKQ